MQITLSGESAGRVLALIGKDRRLATALAQELLRALDPVSIARLLLDRELAVELLVSRLRQRPRQTLGELRELQSSHTARRVARGRPAGRQRLRLSPIEVEALKQRVIRFLSAHPWSNRKQITAGAGIPTQAIYNRLMVELKRARLVVARGTKAKAVYSARAAGPRAEQGKAGRGPRKRKSR